MFKRNQVQGKHAAHAKKDNERKAKVKKIFASKHAEESVEESPVIEDSPVVEEFDQSARPSVDIPELEPHTMRAIDLPEIGDGAVDLGETVRMDAAASEPGASAPLNVPPANQGGFHFNAPEWHMIEPEKERKPIDKKKLGIVLGSVFGVLALVYLIGMLVFSGRFYPNTHIGEQDISMKTIDEAAQAIDGIASDYSIAVKGQGLDFSVSSEEMEIGIDGAEVAAGAHAQVPAWGWPVYVFTDNDLTDQLAAEHNESGLQEIVDAKVEEWNANASDPTNATIAYNTESAQFEVAPEAVGEKLDPTAVLEAVDEAVLSMDSKVEIAEDQLLQPTVFKDDERLTAAAESANGYIGADLQLKMEGYDVGTINGEQISAWITLNEDYEVSFDEGAMDEWLTEYGNSLDTIGSSRTYTRPDGKEVTVEGGTYGWEIDSAALVSTVRDAILDGTQGEITVPVIASGVYYNAENGIDWADYIDVDLSEQHARYITEAGDILWESDFISGSPDGKHDTPTGVWSILSVESPAVLKGEIQAATGKPEYETRVQYWMPFTYQGHGFHDATWQPAFGGSLYSQGYGSHGCVNLPYDAAGALHGTVSVGLPVVVHW